ncbi:OmpH family outer membrane protein [Lignipirellula cremea]|uniref:Outer membrane protein (OmpH-like) n=1 Tax=Lignipirellula cremea TaxID=2528010 RepID=A0A518DT39_9BACT|nr:OmpH family outer membrane protein [Lignipirellula cremea]QDU95015.1 Outer membrane protein (OmpH-like) [Lignipirellula cremea]
MRTALFVLATVCLTAIGCNSASSPSGVAVIDLDEVARRLGRDIKMTEMIKAGEGVVNQQLATVQASYEQQLSDKKAEFGEEATEEANKTLAQMHQQASFQFNQARQQAAAKLSQHRAQLIQQFREEVKPIAREAAAAKGYNIVLTKNDSVLFDFASTHDVTEEVIAAMSKSDYKAPQPITTKPAASTAAKPETTEQK